MSGKVQANSSCKSKSFLLYSRVLTNTSNESEDMASATKKLKVRRKLRKASMGTARKNAARKYGTTQPNLPLNVPNANELAQAKK